MEEVDESHLSMGNLLDRQMSSLWRPGPLPEYWKTAGGEGGVVRVSRLGDAV